MSRIAKTDILDSLIPGRPMTAWQVSRMLALRGCVERDGADDEDRVGRHLSRLAREGCVRRVGRDADGLPMWRLPHSLGRRRRAAG